ncbi:unnamed protein product, partial [Rhizoctonia solani]
LLWDTRSGKMIGSPYEGHTNVVPSVDFSPRGTYVVSGGRDETVRLWDVRTGREVQQFHEHTKSVWSVAFSPCGKYVASGSADHNVIIRNISCEYPESADNIRPHIITNQMSTQQIFDCLIASDCVDLSSQMDTQQDAAIIVSGGGFGDIWNGQLHNGEKVAIKAWRTSAMGQCDYKTLKRAARELYCWSRMEHPNIHQLQGVIIFQDRYLGMVSEWMENGNLHEYILRHPDVDRYELYVDVAAGLEYMHSNNTANVLVSSDGVARISDFDFSVMSEVTSLVFSESSNSRSGSLRWTAPEILLEEVRTRTTQSDVYALGMEIFSGTVPYPDCRTDIGVIRAVERGTLPTRPTKRLGDNQKGNMMWWLLVHCWAWDSRDRPSSRQVVETNRQAGRQDANKRVRIARSSNQTNECQPTRYGSTHVLDSSARCEGLLDDHQNSLECWTAQLQKPSSVRVIMIIHEGHTNAVKSVAFSPEGNLVISGSLDRTIRIWNAHRPYPIGDPLKGHSNSIFSVSYSPLGNIIASASNDSTIRLWDVNTHQQLGEPIQGNSSFYFIDLSPDAKLIASGCGWSGNLDSYTVQLWDVEKRTAASDSFKGHTGYVESVRFSSDGSRVVSGSFDKTIYVWDVQRGATVLGPLEGHSKSVRSAVFSPEGSQIVSCSDDRTLRLWDTRTGGVIGNPLEGHTDHVYSVAFSPRDTYVISGGSDKMIRLWDIRTGREVQSFPKPSIVWSVALSPCGQYVASGSDDCKVTIRNISAAFPDSADNSGPRMITSQMSTEQIFDCLLASGCKDLSSQMDTRQDTAMIMSGGGFGDIWKGQLHNGGKVAIKAWRTSAMGQCDYKTLKRAARELFFWSGMDHPNIHRLQGVIMFRDFYLGMVSEWMDNGNLHEYLLKSPDADRYQLCIHVASGLEYMHSRNTVHGDLKAINVLVSSDGTAKISDFDFSIMSEVSSLVFSESSNSRPGSLRWVALELLLSDTPTRTTQSDVYALGMTILEIFTGEAPYPECRHDFVIMRKVEKGILPDRPLERLKDDKKGNMMWNLLVKCWSGDPNERPSSRQVVDTLVSEIYTA